MFNSFLRKLRGGTLRKEKKDSVCGMKIANGVNLVYQDQTHYFCSDHCREQFKNAPDNYLVK